jgi:hypothetical protein
MPRIYLEGQTRNLDKNIIWDNIETYRGKHEYLKQLFDDEDKAVFDTVSNGIHVVTRNVTPNGRVLFYLYTKEGFMNFLKGVGFKRRQELLDKLDNLK